MISFLPLATKLTRSACCWAVRVLVLQAIATLATLRTAVSKDPRLAALTANGAIAVKPKSPSSPAGPVTGRQPPPVKFIAFASVEVKLPLQVVSSAVTAIPCSSLHQAERIDVSDGIAGRVGEFIQT